MHHEAWSQLLKKYVDSQGMVNYKGFIADSLSLNAYLDSLTNHPPDTSAWSRAAQLAYWINAYNAFTIQLVIRHYPLRSIKDISTLVSIPFVNSPWDIHFIHINGASLDLNDIEHGILRKKFHEPRIHFAINCASISCPRLRDEAYEADKIESQLQQQALAFVNDPARNDVGPDRASLSRIFKWFRGDFTKTGSLRAFINQYAKHPLESPGEISYKAYNWSLNEQ